jgi:polar amino acid transport system permease protein
MAMTPRQRQRVFRIVMYAFAVVVIVAVVLLADWDRIGFNFFNVEVMGDMFPEVITLAARNTIVYTTLSFVFGLVIALALALMKLSTVRPYRAFAIGYIELFRGLPALITLIFIGFGLPIAFDGFRAPGGRQGAGVIGLSIVAGAYMAETIRAGIEAVPRGQVEAARSLGMSRTRTMFSIVLPQAFRIIIPPLTNEMVLLIKDTSLFFVLGTTPMTKELTKFARDFMIDIRNATPLTVAAIVYLVITLPLTYLVRRLERRAAVSR